MLEPVSVALKLGFLIVLYLFLFWVSRSALKDLRARGRGPAVDQATGMHFVDEVITPGKSTALLQIHSAPGLPSGEELPLTGNVTLGRDQTAQITLEDPFASGEHARIVTQGHLWVLEDLRSTNGTYLNDQPIYEPTPLESGDLIRIGESEFIYIEQ